MFEGEGRQSLKCEKKHNNNHRNKAKEKPNTGEGEVAKMLNKEQSLILVMWGTYDN